jgi:hypothetical protein
LPLRGIETTGASAIGNDKRRQRRGVVTQNNRCSN